MSWTHPFPFFFKITGGEPRLDGSWSAQNHALRSDETLPTALRNWGKVSGDDIITCLPLPWDGHNFSADQKLRAWEYAVMHLEFSSSSMKMYHTRGDLLYKDNSLAISGSNIPAFNTPLRKAWYYVYKSLRAWPMSYWTGLGCDSRYIYGLSSGHSRQEWCTSSLMTFSTQLF